jgi:hypothetical protein
MLTTLLVLLSVSSIITLCLLHCTLPRYERAAYPDGRRCNRWYLMDQHGDSHLAVIGIERDTKDGHYHYSAVRGWLYVA